MSTTSTPGSAATGMVIILFPFVYTIFVFLAIIKTARNWEYFGNRSVPMILVTIFIPFGFLWPILSQTEPVQKTMTNATSRPTKTKSKRKISPRITSKKKRR